MESKKTNSRQKFCSLYFRRQMLTEIPKLSRLQSQEAHQLDLSQNFYSSLKGIEQYCFPNLLQLNISINLITQIESLARCYMPNLQKLYMFGNQIKSLKPLRKATLEKLIELRVGYTYRGNNLETLDDFLELQNLKSIEQLTLDMNQISKLDPFQSVPFTTLTVLYLTGNNIETVTQRMLNLFTGLRRLSMRQNNISSIRFLERVCLPLQYISLSNNCITQVPNLYMNSFKQLTRIKLSNSQINGIWDILKCNWPEAAQVQIYQQGMIYHPIKMTSLLQKFIYNIQKQED